MGATAVVWSLVALVPIYALVISAAMAVSRYLLRERGGEVRIWVPPAIFVVIKIEPHNESTVENSTRPPVDSAIGKGDAMVSKTALRSSRLGRRSPAIRVGRVGRHNLFRAVYQMLRVESRPQGALE